MPVMSGAVKPLGVWLLLLLAQQAAAFGANEHRVVGYVAAANVCPATAAALAALDGVVGGDYDLAEAGLWADRIRGVAGWEHAAQWHYMNVGDGAVLPDPGLVRGAPRDVLSAVVHFREVLADTRVPPADRAQALRFFVHFVADIHQPLHVGRQSDRGGNRVKVVANAGERLNLHQFWDGRIRGLAADADPAAFAVLLEQRYGAALRQRWRAATPVDWAMESQRLRAEVYSYPVPARGERVVLDDNYASNAIEIISLRLAQAGVRLAAELDQIFCAAAAPEPLAARP